MNEWISLEEEEPQTCCEYIVYAETLDTLIVNFDQDVAKWDGEEFNFYDSLLNANMRVTHWQPLLEPPE